MSQDHRAAVIAGFRRGIIKGAIDGVLARHSYTVKEFFELAYNEALLEELTDHIDKNLSLPSTTNSCRTVKGPQMDIIRQKGSAMRFVNLAAVAMNISDGGNGPSSQLTGPLAEAMEIHKADQSKAAATELVAMLGAVETTKSNHRRQLRTYRKAQAQEQKKLEAIDRAIAYGNETSNFVPLLVATHQIHSAHEIGVDSEEFEKLKVVPSSFTPSTSTEEAEPPLATNDG